jgi:predicted tellurium resistance membrane protein TerC
MWNFAIFAEPATWIAFLTLAVMEIVLGIDNIVFISILTGRLPADQQARARSLGLTMALVSRLGLLFAISWIMRLTRPLFSVMGHSFSGRDLILLVGGLFLMVKATREIFEKLEVESHAEAGAAKASFGSVIFQITLLDIIFSLDSVITAVGMAQELLVMVLAMLTAVLVMLIFAGAVSDFVNKHPSTKILALSFLMLIGFVLMADGFGKHIEKGYIYFAMGFSLLVELINLRIRKHQRAVQLHRSSLEP